MGEYGTDSFLVKPRRKMFHVDFVGKGMVMVICFGNVLFSLSSVFGIFLNLLFLCHLIAVNGHVAYSGMVGCLALMVMVVGIPGLSLLVIWPLFILRGV